MTETVEQFLKRGGTIQEVEPDAKAKRVRKDYSSVTICVASRVEHTYSDGSRHEVYNNTPKTRAQRKAEQKVIARNKGNYTKPKY